MIKLQNILAELRSVKNLDKIDQTKKYTLLWSDGNVSAIVPDDMNSSMMMTMSKQIPLAIDPNKKTISIQDYDDWSSFRDILKFQQAVKDVMKLKLVDSNWTVSIPMSDVKNNIGSGKLTDFLNYNASFTDTIPKAFHGTTEKDLESIKRLGILPPNKATQELLKWTNYYGPDSADKTYWSIDFNRAEYYAKNAANMYKQNKIKTKPIVIEVHNLPADKVAADDDFQSNMGMVQLLAALQHGGKIDNTSAIQSIRNTSQFAYKGRVPASMIVKIHKV
jgi:hypothetical protein